MVVQFICCEVAHHKKGLAGGMTMWLASVLKLHCAPMRDEWVDDMYQELSNGNRNNDMTGARQGDAHPPQRARGHEP